MSLKNRLTLFVAVAVAGAKAYGAGGGPMAVGTLRQQADVVAIATVESLANSPEAETLQLQVVKALQGQPASLSLTAKLAPPRGTRGAGGMLPPSAIGATGVWFLKMSSGAYQVLPLFDGPYMASDVFIPLQGLATASAPVGTLDQQLLAYQLQAHQSSPNPSPRDDQRLMASLVYGNASDGLAAAQSLISAVSLTQHTMGLAAAIRLGSDQAGSQVAAELDMLRSSPKFGHVVATIEGYPPVQTPTAISALGKLISLHSDVSGLDGAASMALERIGHGATTGRSPLPAKAVLPDMVLTLDSKDPNAQLRAARFFGYFTMFADANGSIAGNGLLGPFATADTRQFTPSKATAITPAQYAEFWKVWWSQNKAKFGF